MLSALTMVRMRPCSPAPSRAQMAKTMTLTFIVVVLAMTVGATTTMATT